MTILRGDLQTLETERPECFKFPPRVPEGIVSPEDARDQRDIGLLFDKALALDPKELYERAPIHRLRDWVIARDPGQLCHYIDTKISEALETPLEMQSLDQLILVIEELNIGQTSEKPEVIPATVTIQNQLYFLKDLLFYQLYPELFDIAEAETATALAMPMEKRYSSVELYPAMAKAAADLGLPIDPTIVDFEHFQPNIKYASSRATEAVYDEKFQRQIRKIAQARGIFSDTTLKESDYKDIRDQALEQLNSLIAQYPEDSEVLALRTQFIASLQAQKDTVRCRMFFDRAEDLNSACEVLNHALATAEAPSGGKNALRLEVVHHISNSYTFYRPFDHGLSADPAHDIAQRLIPNPVLIHNSGLYASVHTTVPVEVDGTPVEMEFQFFPACERPLVALMHTSLTRVGVSSLDERGLTPQLNDRIASAAKGVDLFLAQA